MPLDEFLEPFNLVTFRVNPVRIKSQEKNSLKLKVIIQNAIKDIYSRTLSEPQKNSLKSTLVILVISQEWWENPSPCSLTLQSNHVVAARGIKHPGTHKSLGMSTAMVSDPSEEQQTSDTHRTPSPQSLRPAPGGAWDKLHGDV